MFKDPDPGATARYKLNQLKQGSMTAMEFISAFKLAKVNSGLNDVALVDIFKRGLNRPLVEKIYNLPIVPSTLEEWFAYANRFDLNWRQLQQLNKQESKTPTSTSITPKSSKPSSFKPSIPNFPSSLPSLNNPSPNQHPTSSFPVPMEVDSTRGSREIVCFKCRRKGHKANQCTSSFNINNMTFEDLRAYFQNSPSPTSSFPPSQSTPPSSSTSQDFL